MPRPADRHHGFTLIELLVVISIIALLISILLPALGTAQREAQLIQSLSNLRQIGMATKAYAADNKENLPVTTIDNGNFISSWSFGGKFSSSYWSINQSAVDPVPNTRPLNEYLYSGQLHPPVSGREDIEGFRRPANESERTNLELPVFKSPRDIASMQRKWPNPTPGISSYDDVGTSYHSNLKWLRPLQFATLAMKPRPSALNLARDYLRKQQNLNTSRFVIYYDQALDVMRTGSYRFGLTVIDGEYGRENHSAMVFFDGHVSFEEVIPNADSGASYDLIFDLP